MSLSPGDRQIHLDSSVYIAFLNGETISAHAGMNRVDLAELILDAGEAGLIGLSTSTITIVEVRRGVDPGSNSVHTQVAQIDSLFDRTLTRFVEVDRDVALAARGIANHYGINTMDAIQVASAAAAGCDELFIWDNRIVNRFSAEPLPGLKVCEPYPLNS